MKHLEALLWFMGLALLLVFFATHAWGERERLRDVSAFSQVRESSQAGVDELSAKHEQAGEGEVLAILRIGAIGLELPVRYGTEERVLRRGPGLIEGTAFPGSLGNVAIAAHRDIHFRGLKDLELGDQIELEVADRTQSYVVTGLSVVEPTDIHVLDETGQAVLTLVTCYPFYFVGNAPERFIVRAEASGVHH